MSIYLNIDPQIISIHCYDLILHTFIFCRFLRIYRFNECPMTSSFRIRVKNISILKCTRVQKACKLPFTLILNTQYTKDLLLAYEIFREKNLTSISKAKDMESYRRNNSKQCVYLPNRLLQWKPKYLYKNYNMQ